MIQINVIRASQEIVGFEISGHADYADSGKDIVCAAVSSQVISVENSLDQLLGIQVFSEVDEVAGGYLRIMLPPIDDEGLRQDAQLLMRHLEFAYTTLANHYPQYIKLNS